VKSGFVSMPLLAALLAGCAAAPPPAPPEKQYRTMAEANAEAKDDDLICRSERPVGSRMEKKVCATRAEWELAHKRAQDEMGRAQRGATLPRD
jgi:PBP1b-binding outer membrane lipoprotein LpoB